MSIIQKIMNWVGNLLLGESPKNNNANKMVSSQQALPSEEPGGNVVVEKPKTEDKKSDTNSVEIRKKIKKCTLSTLHSLYMTNSENCKSKQLIVWIDTDKTTFKSYSDFGLELADYWAVESGYVFEKVELKCGKPENEQDAKKVEVDIDAFSVYIQEVEANPESENIVKKACISIFGNKGSLLQEQYELSSEVLEKEHRKYYNIGRGEFPDMEGGSYRQNHIAIDDKNNLEVNRYVSRSHARIGYSENIGFYLQVEMGGSRLSGNRTRIFRGEDKIEVENVEVKEPLHDGDLIELGKAVVLKFVETE